MCAHGCDVQHDSGGEGGGSDVEVGSSAPPPQSPHPRDGRKSVNRDLAAAALGSCDTSPSAPRGLLLHLFAGGPRDGSFAHFATALGFDVIERDIILDPGHNLVDDGVFAEVMELIQSGAVKAVLLGTPCGTFSVLRIPQQDGREGPPQLRDRLHPMGMPGVPRQNLNELATANVLVRRTVIIAQAIADAGGVFIIENPPDRGDGPLYQAKFASHAPLWLVPEVIELADRTGAIKITFPQCALGSDFQKWTTLLVSPQLVPQLVDLSRLACQHPDGHRDVAVGARAARAAAYPPLMNRRLAEAISDCLTSLGGGAPKESSHLAGDAAGEASEPAGEDLDAPAAGRGSPGIVADAVDCRRNDLRGSKRSRDGMRDAQLSQRARQRLKRRQAASSGEAGDGRGPGCRTRPDPADPPERDTAADTELLPEAAQAPAMAVGSAMPHAGPLGEVAVGLRSDEGSVDITRLGVLGNPFPIRPLVARGMDDEVARRAVCDAHRLYLRRVMNRQEADLAEIAGTVGAPADGQPLVYQQPPAPEAVRGEIDRLAFVVARGGRLLLGCVCAPEQCHGDAVKEAILTAAMEKRVCAEPRGPPASGSLRRLVPEQEDVLRGKLLPVANEPPSTDPVEPPAEDRTPPAPLRTAELIPGPVIRRLRRFRRDVRKCLRLAAKGKWKRARGARPEAIYLSEEEAILPAGRGWTWRHDPDADLWHPISPSAWPSSEPVGELDRAAVAELATDYPDQEIVSYMLHGYPGPHIAPRCLLGQPHVGALKEHAGFAKCAAKDRAKGWVEAGRELPPVWPYCADPFNVVERYGKYRMTIDKTMTLVPGVTSYNDSVDLHSIDPVEYATIRDLAEASAILATAGVPIALWGFDLEAYFRKTGKQRRDVWMSGFVHEDGFGLDERIQFGQREAPVLMSRQSCYLVWAIRREIERLEAKHPPRDPVVRRWLEARRRLAAGAAAYRGAALSFILMYVDDLGGVCVDDDVEVDGVVWRRSQLYYEAAKAVVEQLGHSMADDKLSPPSREGMEFLGAYLRILDQRVLPAEGKCERYAAATRAVLDVEPSGGVVVVPKEALNSLTHKLLHAASFIPLGRQHLYHVRRALKAENRLAGARATLGRAALAELRWQLAQLELQEPVGVPFATRSRFPAAGSAGVLTPYSDASKEEDSSESGFGAWCVIDGTFVYVEGRWTPEECKQHSINVLELAAMNIGTFAFLDYAEGRGFDVQYVHEFVDNEAAEFVADRGKPRAPAMEDLLGRRYEAFWDRGIFAAASRIASVDNDIADGLSRGGERLEDALRIAAASGMPTLKLEPQPRWRQLS